MRRAIRVRHYSLRTEDAYLGWIKRFILFHGKRHPAQMGETEVGAFLTELAVNGRVAAATQNQALNAIVFLYKVVLGRPLAEINGVVRAKKSQRLPVVLTVEEVQRLLRHLSGTHWLVACLLYGSGLRLMEAGAVGPPGRAHHADLHSCDRARWQRGGQPVERAARGHLYEPQRLMPRLRRPAMRDLPNPPAPRRSANPLPSLAGSR